jgi:hypothetical protein
MAVGLSMLFAVSSGRGAASDESAPLRYFGRYASRFRALLSSTVPPDPQSDLDQARAMR